VPQAPTTNSLDFIACPKLKLWTPYLIRLSAQFVVLNSSKAKALDSIFAKVLDSMARPKLKLWTPWRVLDSMARPKLKLWTPYLIRLSAHSIRLSAQFVVLNLSKAKALDSMAGFGFRCSSKAKHSLVLPKFISCENSFDFLHVRDLCLVICSADKSPFR
jgi:hypothetical protein